MQTGRLFSILYLLMEHGNMTAKQLAERFEVSPRTIYRDIDLLSGAGIPIYASKGKGGGIQLLSHFVLDRSLLSSEEQDEILFALQSLRAASMQGTQVLSRLHGLFQKRVTDWIDVDFSSWNGASAEREIFGILKTGILEQYVLEFSYSNTLGETARRCVEPMKLHFRNSSWYLLAYCRTRQDYRTFKISRMQHVCLTGQRFTRDQHSLPEMELPSYASGHTVPLVLQISAKMAYRVYDEFPADCIRRRQDGTFVVSIEYPDDPWLCGYLLSFGDAMKILSPPEIQNRIACFAHNIADLYEK